MRVPIQMSIVFLKKHLVQTCCLWGSQVPGISGIEIVKIRKWRGPILPSGKCDSKSLADGISPLANLLVKDRSRLWDEICIVLNNKE